MTVIVIGTHKVDSELIDQIADSLGSSGGEVISMLERLYPDETPLFDSFNSSNLVFTPREPVKIPEVFDIVFDCGYSYHPNHGEPCDHLWVDPSDIHDQLSVLAGYFMVFFHRKCFMRLKTFSNLRFTR